MKRIEQIFLLGLTLMMCSCGSESSLPVATGKAELRAINAMPASPGVRFLIEERLISNIAYKDVSVFAEYDDLVYDFNFDVLFAGDTQNTRIVTRNLDVIANQDYTFLISGSVTAPVLTLWESTIREFTAGATVFQARFAHASNTLGSVDFYFAADGIAPALGQEVATLSFGEVATEIDFESGPYVLIITSSGDPSDVLYTSGASTFAAQANNIVAPFDGDSDDNAPFVVRVIGSQGSISTLPDPNFPATVEFVHASLALGPSDIYDDEALSSQVLPNHIFQDRSVDISVAAGSSTFRYTPAGDTAVVSVEGSMTTVAGQRNRFVVIGDSGAFATAAYALDLTPVDTAAKIQLFHTSSNFSFLDFYIVNAGVLIDDELPFRGGLGGGFNTPASGIVAGIYDVYVTDFGDKTILAGPLVIDVVNGDVVDLFVFDTVDPAVLDLQRFPTP